jgi:glycosyltransferase involved in cell wall biosynthesis
MIWKGVDGLIRTLQRLPESHHLYVAGEGDELDSWTALAARLGLAQRVHFTGHVPHERLMAWIRAADVFLLNSTYEGLSHTLLEVMWLGTPAAVSAVGGNLELIEDRVNGRRFAPSDEAAIAAAVQAIVSDGALARRYAESARVKVAAGFAREGIFTATERLFLEVTGRLADADTPAHTADSPLAAGGHSGHNLPATHPPAR